VGNNFVPVYPPCGGSQAAQFANRYLPVCKLPEKKRAQWVFTSEEMKQCQWLKPELVAQIEFAEWTPDGHLRHSKFVGLRDDKDAREVVRDMDR
jgi:ATP-dependent DNA ligase